MKRQPAKSKDAKSAYKKKKTGGQSTNKIAAVTDTRAYKEQKQSVDTIMSLTPAGGAQPAYVLGPRNFLKAGSITVLNTLKGGSAIYERGNTRRIRMKSIRVVGAVEALDGDQITWNDACMMLVYDRNPNKALPSDISLILSDYATGCAGSAYTTPYSGVNIGNSDRFVILRRHNFGCHTGTAALNGNVGLTNGRLPVEIDWYVKLTDNEAHYDGDAGTISDITSGALYLILYASTDNKLKFFGNARLRFLSI
jgi:hypothetical protein